MVEAMRSMYREKDVCAFCYEEFSDVSEKCRRVEWSRTYAALEHMRVLDRPTTLGGLLLGAHMNTNPDYVRVVVALARAEGLSLCNYCHTRVTVSRDAAEAL